MRGPRTEGSGRLDVTRPLGAILRRRGVLEEAAREYDRVREHDDATRGAEQLAREVEDEHQGHGHDHHDVPGHEEEATSIGVVYVAHGCDTPEHAADEDGGEGDDDTDEAYPEALQDSPALATERGLPALEVARETANEGRLAAHRHDDRGQLFVLLQKGAKGLLTFGQRSIR